MRFVFAIVMCLCLASVGVTAESDLGVLRHYLGDWMIGESRKQLATTRLVDDGSAVQMHFGYRAHFNWVRQTWHMRHDAATNKYIATVTGKTTDTAIGLWDEQRKVMTWTIDVPTEPGGRRAKPLGPLPIVHRFGERTIHWSTVQLDGSEVESRALRWDLLFRHTEPEP